MHTYRRSAALALAAVIAAAGCAGQDGADGANGTNGTNGTPGLGFSTGLRIDVTGVTVATDGTVTATLSMRDDQGNPIDKAGVYSQGAVAPRFSLAQVASTTSPWVNITKTSTGGATTQLNTASANTGTLTEVGTETGSYTYVFPSKYTNLAAGGADAAKSTTLMIQATRTIDPLDPRTVFVRNVEFDFMPGGTGTPINREIVLTANCNQCHAPLAIHGGGRREPKFCGNCHNPTALVASYGEGWDLGHFVHTIHSGQVDAVTGDWSGVTYPQEVTNCLTCHKNAALGDNFKNNPTKLACTGCHTNVTWVASGANTCGGVAPPAACNHPTPTQACTVCHADTDIVGAHMPVTQVTTVKIDSVTVTAGVPTLKFTVKTGADAATATPRDLATAPLETIRVARGYGLAGAGRSFEFYSNGSDNIVATVTSTGTPGQYQANLGAMALNDANGAAFTAADVVAFGMEVAESTTVAAQPSDLYWVHWDGAALTSTESNLKRRTIVDTAKCKSCHGDEFGFHHSGSRNNAQECSFCHRANATNSGNQAKAQLDPLTNSATRVAEPIQLATMIHKLHTGEASGDASWMYRGYSGGSVAGGAALERATYPGNRMQCDQCHVSPANAGAANWGLPGAVVPATIAKDTIVCTDGGTLSTTVACAAPVTTRFNIPKTVAVCGACHDNDLTQAHMAQNVIGAAATGGGTELCSLCHAKYDVGDPLAAHFATPR